MQRLKRTLKRLALASLGIAMGLVIAECTLRVLGIGYPLPYSPDEFCGTRLSPGFEGYWLSEGKSHFSVNSAGFRDRERSLPKPANTVRIAVLGDSFVEALQVPLEQTFCSVLERELRDRQTFGDRDVEVLSFGVSGFGTGQQLQVLRHYVWDYDPDIVVLAFFPGNDIADNSRALSANTVKPFFTLNEGALSLDDSFRQHPDYLKAQSRWTRFKVAVINHSRLLQLIARARGTRQADDRSDKTSQGDVGVDELCFVEPNRPEWKGAWEVTERLVVEIKNDVQQHGARFLLVTVSSPIQVDPRRAMREARLESLGVEDFFYCERRLASLAERESFSILPLGPSLQRLADESGEYLHGFENTRMGTGHWNAAGHQQAGELLADSIENLVQETRTHDQKTSDPIWPSG